jgi:hypothetical protein
MPRVRPSIVVVMVAWTFFRDDPVDALLGLPGQSAERSGRPGHLGPPGGKVGGHPTA